MSNPVKSIIYSMVTVKRRVTELGGQYFVQQMNADGTWKTLGNPYVHQTSAYAALGRIVHNECTESV